MTSPYKEIDPPKLIIPGRYAFACNWPTLRWGIIDTILCNPDIAPYRRRMVKSVVLSICKTYQTYCKAHRGSPTPLDTYDVITEIDYYLNDDESHISAEAAVYNFLRQLYDPSYLDGLNEAFKHLTAAEPPDSSEAYAKAASEQNDFKRELVLHEIRKWAFPVEDLLVAFAAALPEYDELIHDFA